jgi:hypothetical protein
MHGKKTYIGNVELNKNPMDRNAILSLIENVKVEDIDNLEYRAYFQALVLLVR